MSLTKQEVLAKAWIVCDPNRAAAREDMDAPAPPMALGGAGQETTLVTTELTGKPRWHWFIPRAEALEKFLNENGFEIVEKAP